MFALTSIILLWKEQTQLHSQPYEPILVQKLLNGEEMNKCTNNCGIFISVDADVYSTFEIPDEQTAWVLQALLVVRGDIDTDAVVKAKDLYESCINVRDYGIEPLLNVIRSTGTYMQD